jgi:recombinational DNA repair protein (RecF pathway)
VPGQQVQTIALLLAREPSGSDAFERLTAFSEEHGLLHCLRRLAKKTATAAAIPLDLFDEAELWLESSNQGRTWFIKEYRHLARHPGIGRSYDALKVAAALATLVSHNPVPDESRPDVAALLRRSFAALDQGARADLVWFKALFVRLRDEGYPVKEQWWRQLPAADRTAAAEILNRPLAGQNSASEPVAHLARMLEDWLRAETELKL